MQESKVTKEELFAQFQLNFFTLSSYIRASYDPLVMGENGLTFDVIRDSLSDGQTASKLWVVNELSKLDNMSSSKIAVFGGWVGLLCRFIFDFLKCSEIKNIEIDSSLERVNNYVMAGHSGVFQFIHSDMYNFPYKEQEFDVYVNTSGEHIPSIKEWIEMIPTGKIVCIQSNDYFSHPQHINCVNNATELKAQALAANNVKDVIYCGTLKLPIYDRFMIIALT